MIHEARREAVAAVTTTTAISTPDAHWQALADLDLDQEYAGGRSGEWCRRRVVAHQMLVDPLGCEFAPPDR